ncbi:S1 RNA-binding domain-containing protein [Streptomyces luteocolor]|nr:MULTISPECIES: S1 RNA-binding domain-containing protein [Streptomyces]
MRGCAACPPSPLPRNSTRSCRRCAPASRCPARGLVPLGELAPTPPATPEEAVRVGEEVTVVVTAVERDRRRLTFSRRQA